MTKEPKAPTAAASAGVAIPARIVPRTKSIKVNRGKNDTTTSFAITPLGGISYAFGFGASSGFHIAKPIAYKIYKLASNNPGSIAAANNLSGDS